MESAGGFAAWKPLRAHRSTALRRQGRFAMRFGSSAGRSLGLGSAAFAALATVAPALAQVTVTEFHVPTAGSRPYTIVPGPDGNLWFTESNGNKIGRITTDGKIVEYKVPTAASGPYGIAVGADGNIWFTERFGDQIGRLDPDTPHVISEFPIPTPLAQAWEIAPGSDGNLWFTEEDVDQVARITPQGSIAEFDPGVCCFPTGIAPGVDGNVWYTVEIGDWIGRLSSGGLTSPFLIPTVQVLPWDISAGPDGNIWFTELSGRAIGRVTPAGSITEFPIPGEFSGIAGVTAGPDGNIWYTENDTDHVGVIDTNGNPLASYDVAAGSRPLSITPGPDGNLWFTEADGNAIGRMNIAPRTGGFALSMDAGFAPRRQGVKLGETVKWMFLGPRAHSVVDASGLGLFDSGSHSMVSYYSYTFGAASTFQYKDGVNAATPLAQISVPVSLPASGMVGQPFSVMWSTSTPAAGIVFDVQIKMPGQHDFTPWKSSVQAMDNYTPTEAGTYFFRARMRSSSGPTALYSGQAPIVVN
jgi:streptogramin lyase